MCVSKDPLSRHVSFCTASRSSPCSAGLAHCLIAVCSACREWLQCLPCRVERSSLFEKPSNSQRPVSHSLGPDGSVSFSLSTQIYVPSAPLLGYGCAQRVLVRDSDRDVLAEPGLDHKLTTNSPRQCIRHLYFTVHS